MNPRLIGRIDEVRFDDRSSASRCAAPAGTTSSTALLLLLASAASGYMTGSVVTVDGGFSVGL